MKFTKEMIEAIAWGQKTQTRRLVEPDDDDGMNIVHSCKTGNWEVKWEVGQEELVQNEAGEDIWWCWHGDKLLAGAKKSFVLMVGVKIQPLRIQITALPKERLCNITEKNAKAEGCLNRFDFLHYFCNIYQKEIPQKYIDAVDKRFKKLEGNPGDHFIAYGFSIANEWNPLVWAISFKVLGAERRKEPKESGAKQSKFPRFSKFFSLCFSWLRWQWLILKIRWRDNKFEQARKQYCKKGFHKLTTGKTSMHCGKRSFTVEYLSCLFCEYKFFATVEDKRIYLKIKNATRWPTRYPVKWRKMFADAVKRKRERIKNAKGFK